jgi:hypothetical protein
LQAQPKILKKLTPNQKEICPKKKYV